MSITARFRLAAITFILVLSSTGSGGQTLVDVKPRDTGLAVPGLFGEVDFWGQTNHIYGVKVALGGRMAAEAQRQPNADARGMQVWLLQPDGTSIPPLDGPAAVSSGRFGMVHDDMIFTFKIGRASCRERV